MEKEVVLVVMVGLYVMTKGRREGAPCHFFQKLLSEGASGLFQFQKGHCATDKDILHLGEEGNKEGGRAS